MHVKLDRPHVLNNGVFCGGHADFRKDLHNFAFLGRSARIGTASDWVWYNVPHGPQKQVESFFQGQRCIREGREQARPRLLHGVDPKPWT